MFLIYFFTGPTGSRGPTGATGATGDTGEAGVNFIASQTSKRRVAREAAECQGESQSIT